MVTIWIAAVLPEKTICEAVNLAAPITLERLKSLLIEQQVMEPSLLAGLTAGVNGRAIPSSYVVKHGERIEFCKPLSEVPAAILKRVRAKASIPA